MTINNKGVNQYKITSYHRFLITTNELFDSPINTSKEGDKRHLLIIRSSDEKCGDSAYFTNLHEILEDIDTIKTCFEYFKSLDGLENFNSLPIPKTAYQNELKELSKSPIEAWLEDFTLENSDKAEIVLSGTECFDSYRRWFDKNNVSCDVSTIQFGMRLTNLKISGVAKGPKTERGKTKRFDINQLNKHFSN